MCTILRIYVSISVGDYYFMIPLINGKNAEAESSRFLCSINKMGKVLVTKSPLTPLHNFSLRSKKTDWMSSAIVSDVVFSPGDRGPQPNLIS